MFLYPPHLTASWKISEQDSRVKDFGLTSFHENTKITTPEQPLTKRLEPTKNDSLYPKRQSQNEMGRGAV